MNHPEKDPVPQLLEVLKHLLPESVALQAIELVNGARRRDYGHPKDNFSSIAHAWNNWLHTRYPHQRGWHHPYLDLDNQDVGMMMILMKIMRQGITPKEDNLVDIAGYAEATKLATTAPKISGAALTPVNEEQQNFKSEMESNQSMKRRKK